jgi:hypothetical protein
MRDAAAAWRSAQDAPARVVTRCRTLLHHLQHPQRGYLVRRSATDRRVSRKQFIKTRDVVFGVSAFVSNSCAGFASAFWPYPVIHDIRASTALLKQRIARVGLPKHVNTACRHCGPTRGAAAPFGGSVPHVVVPAVTERETNQVQRTQSQFLACSLCSGGTRCAWTVLDEIASPVGSHSLFCLASPPYCPTKSKAAQGRPRMTCA